MKTITAKELKNTTTTEFVLVDVRENDERAAAHIDGIHIPLAEIPSRAAEIPQDTPVVVYCRGGVRSARAIEYLESIGYTNLTNLQGGIVAYLAD